MPLVMKLTQKGGRDALIKWAGQKQVTVQKAMSLALSKAAFDLYKTAAQELKTGQLGLQPRAVYRNDSNDKRYKRRAGRAKAPLRSLFRGITYRVDRKALTAVVGFRGATAGTAWQARIAAKSVTGYRIPISEDYRDRLTHFGIILRKTTTSVNVPRRDIMGAVKAKHEHVVLASIQELFTRKMAGERI